MGAVGKTGGEKSRAERKDKTDPPFLADRLLRGSV